MGWVKNSGDMLHFCLAFFLFSHILGVKFRGGGGHASIHASRMDIREQIGVEFLMLDDIRLINMLHFCLGWFFSPPSFWGEGVKKTPSGRPRLGPRPRAKLESDVESGSLASDFCNGWGKMPLKPLGDEEICAVPEKTVGLLVFYLAGFGCPIDFLLGKRETLQFQKNMGLVM